MTILPALALVALAATTGTKVGDRIPHFTARTLELSDGEPRASDFDPHRTGRVTAYLFVGTTCPATHNYVERMRNLERAYRQKGVDFVFVYPNRTDSSDDKKTFHQSMRLGGRMIDDQGAKVARALAAQRTSEVLLVGRDGVILYRGGIDDSPADATKATAHWVAAALDEHLAGKPVTRTTTEVRA